MASSGLLYISEQALAAIDLQVRAVLTTLS